MLCIKNLQCYYGKIRALKDVCIHVEQGELICLIGANGSGKSTLLQAVSGLNTNWDGEILYQDRSLKGLDASDIVKEGISMVPEGRLIFSPLSVMDNLILGAYTLRQRKGTKDFSNDLENVMALFPVLSDRSGQPAGTLSGGEQQMLAIGRALMARPRLLVLDEPSMGLAPLLVEKILSTLVLLRDQGVTILLVEQNARAALKIADRGYVLETGRVVLEGRSSDLLNDDKVKGAYLGKGYGQLSQMQI